MTTKYEINIINSSKEEASSKYIYQVNLLQSFSVAPQDSGINYRCTDEMLF